MTSLITISLIALLLSVFLREYNKIASITIMIIASIIIFIKISVDLTDIFNALKSISLSVETATTYIKLMIKVLGIVLITQFIADLCRDCGENALAGQTETASKIIVITMILPLFETVIKIVSGFLE